ncbi:MAG: nucleoside triphosphate pyrophosphohydrolase [Deltaproteobacteria bacterium]|nr:nucleoside triphosphate pyrophosphohydrolase [Deltaproteobacteria bacterium]
MKADKTEIAKLVSLMKRLRSADGCPWDKGQTLDSLVPFIIEEAYEVIAAIDEKSFPSIKEELGDLLFQIVFASRIAEEAGRFDLNDVIAESYEKMIRRHPHVFGDKTAKDSAEVLRRWSEIKREEKKGKPFAHGLLSDVPSSMPALMRAHKVSHKAAKAGFDWIDVAGALDKLDEEIDEFKKAVNDKDPSTIEEELGDILFTLVNVARHLDANPENALRKTIGKFITRFHHVEQAVQEQGKDISETPMAALEALWQEAKGKEKGR